MERITHEPCTVLLGAFAVPARSDGTNAMTEELEADPAGADEDAPTAGTLNAALARAVVGIYRAHAGRGPTQARAFFDSEIVVVVLKRVMTAPERTLVQNGRLTGALAARQALQALMRPQLVDVVEHLTGGTVTSSMSDTDIERDVAAEVFVLERPVGLVNPPVALDGEGST
jgi:uncharacterized protein YbcI